MLVRIQGKVTAIDIIEGVSEKTGKKWSKKVYTISDDFKNPEYNHSVKVNDFGKPQPNTFEYVFDYKSNHVVDETVDIACYIETNDKGFTNLDYCKEFADIDKPKETNIIKPEEAQVEEAPVEMQEQAPNDLPF